MSGRTRKSWSYGGRASRKYATSSRTDGARMGELSGRVALVTGTAHGIGTAIADGLEQDGATVHRVDRDTADLADPRQVARLIERIGSMDILVDYAGCVGGQGWRSPDEISGDDWRASVAANMP